MLDQKILTFSAEGVYKCTMMAYVVNSFSILAAAAYFYYNIMFGLKSIYYSLEINQVNSALFV